MYTGSNQSRRKFKARTHGSRLYREMRWKLQRRNQAFLRLLRVKLPLPSLFSCLLPFTKANIKVRIPVHDAYLLSMQMRNVSAEVDAKRYGNVNRVTVPAAVPSRHRSTDQFRVATTLEEESPSQQPEGRPADLFLVFFAANRDLSPSDAFILRDLCCQHDHRNSYCCDACNFIKKVD